MKIVPKSGIIPKNKQMVVFGTSEEMVNRLIISVFVFFRSFGISIEL